MKCLTSLLGVAGIVVFSIASHAQTTTVRSGKWSSPSTWSNGIVPNASHGEIIINHDVDVPEDTAVTVDELVLNATLTISKRAQLVLQHARGVPADLSVASSGNLMVYGRLTCLDSASIIGTSSLNTFFLDSSVYEHQYFNIAGEPPTATWSDHSTLEFTGFTTGKSLSSLKWNQVYGNVIYNCQAQRSGTFVEFLGNIQTIKNDLIIKSTGAGMLRVTLDKTALTTISIGGDYVIEGRSLVWMSRNGNTRINVAGDFEYRSIATASSYLTTQGNGELNIDGNFLMNSVGILRFASSGGGMGTINVKKNFNLVTGTMTFVAPGQGLVSMSGNTSQSFNITGTLASEVDVEIANSNGVLVTTGSAVGGNILIKSSGRLILPVNTFSLQGNLTVETGADLVSNHGTLLLNGNGDQSLSLLGDTLHHIDITKPAGSTVGIASTLNQSGTLKINNAGVTVFSNGNLTLLSTNDNGAGEGSVAALPAGSSVEGNVTVQRFMSGEGRIYRYLSSPVANGTVADWKDDFSITGTFDDPSSGGGLNTTSPSLFEYDETFSGDGWQNYPRTGLASENALTPGKGYSAFIRRAATPTVWDVTGKLNQQSIKLPVTYTATVDSLMDGWNLVGNPYASTIDWDRDEGWTRTNIASKIAIRDNSSGTFKYWDGSVGNLTHGRIAVGQAFWIQATGPNPTLTIHENAKATSPGIFFRKKKQDVDVLQMTLSGKQVSDECFLKLDPEATHRFDIHDLNKWPNDVLNFSFVTDSIALAIDVRKVIDCGAQIPLLMNFARNADGRINPTYLGKYSFLIDARGLFRYAEISVHDHYLDSVFTFNSDPYIFLIDNDPRSYFENRFSVEIVSRDEENTSVINHDSLVCETSPDPIINIPRANKGVRYDCLINDQLFSSSLPDRDTAISISVSKHMLSSGGNSIRVVARNTCQVIDDIHLAIRKSEVFSSPVFIETHNAIISNMNGDWYYEGKMIAKNEISITPTKSGWYEQKINMNGCTSVAGVNFIYQETDWRYAPVPTNGSVTITAPKGTLISFVEIISPTGMICERRRYSNEREVALDLDWLQTGIYFARVSGTNGLATFRLYKQ